MKEIRWVEVTTQKEWDFVTEKLDYEWTENWFMFDKAIPQYISLEYKTRSTNKQIVGKNYYEFSVWLKSNNYTIIENESFKLPTKWYIEITQENCEIVNKWKQRINPRSYPARIYKQVSNIGTGLHIDELKAEITWVGKKITTEQFKKYVLKEEDINDSTEFKDGELLYWKGQYEWLYHYKHGKGFTHFYTAIKLSSNPRVRNLSGDIYTYTTIKPRKATKEDLDKLYSYGYTIKDKEFVEVEVQQEKEKPEYVEDSIHEILPEPKEIKIAKKENYFPKINIDSLLS